MLKVLIAEDDLMIADMVEETLVRDGYEVCGIARTVAEAVALGRRHKPDLAVIDLRLADGGLGTEIAAQLSSPGNLGILYATGNMSQLMLTAADGGGCLAKPYSSKDLLLSLKIVAEIVTTGTATRPFPRGFQVLRSATIAPQGPSNGYG
jgi:DNA-binding response OmpR family regulator